jgi:hypothetical protein
MDLFTFFIRMPSFLAGALQTFRAAFPCATMCLEKAKKKKRDKYRKITPIFLNIRGGYLFSWNPHAVSTSSSVDHS